MTPESPGSRVGWALRGTYVTMNPGGFVYRRREHSAPGAPRRLVEQTEGQLHTASAAELAQSSPEWMVSDAQERLRRPRWFLYYVIASLFLLGATARQPGVAVALLVVLGIAGFFVHRWDRERRTSRVIYDVDDPEMIHRLALASAIAHQLASCDRLWHIFYAVSTSDWKRNAGANKLIERTVTRCHRGALPHFELNVQTWCVSVGPQRLMFLPDRLLVWDGQALAALPYEHLEAMARSTSFIEDGDRPPSDGKRVGTTWRYVRRDGGPDRRFNNNAQLPIMEYGELELRSSGGLQVVLQTSTHQAAVATTQAFAALAHRAASPALAASPSLALPPARMPVLPLFALGSPTQHAFAPAESPSARGYLVEPIAFAAPRARSLAVLMRYLAAADRRLDPAEIALATQLLIEMSPTDPELPALASQFRELPFSPEAVEVALRDLAGSSPGYRSQVLAALERLANADGKTTPKEVERLRELRRSLKVS